MRSDLDTVLSDADHDHFLSHGFVYLRGLVPADACARAVQAIEAGTEHSEIAPMVYPDELTRAVRELFGDYDVPARSYIDDKPKPHNPDGFWAALPHCDLIYPTIAPELWGVGAFVFLTRSQPRGGAFLFAPGSPIGLGIFASRNTAEAIWGACRDEQIAGPLTEAIVEAGDVLFFQHRMTHAGSRNSSDPVTRHALRVTWPSTDRVDSSGKSLEEMSTVEKANSVRWLRHRFGDHVVVVEPRDGAERPFLENAITHDILRLDGRFHVFSAHTDAPAVIRHRSSADLTDWVEHDEVTLVSEPIRSLHAEYRFDPTLIVVTDGPSRTSRIYTTPDGSRFKQVAASWDVALGRPFFLQASSVGKFFSKEALATGLPFVPDSAPSEIWARWGVHREEMGEWGRSRQMATSPGPVHAAYVGCAYDARRYILVADIVEPDGTIRLYASHSGFQDDFPEQLQPVQVQGGETAHNLRVIERHRGVWFASVQIGDSALFATIDWMADEPVLCPVTSLAELRRALEIVGLG